MRHVNAAAMIALSVTATALAQTWQAGPPLPAGARARHGMAYDSSRGKVVLFGGIGAAQQYNDTWEFDGTSWSAGPAAPAGLTPRDSFGMDYDAARQVCVLFGGWTGVTMYNQTWEYDGSAWTPGATAPAGLTPRINMSLAYDSVRNRSVLFGGYDNTSAFKADTWEYNGAWSQGPAAPAALVPREGYAMAFDSAARKIVLFGGLSQFTPTNVAHNDTWYYDGAAWTQGPAAPAALTPRFFCAAGYDDFTLYGGSDVNNQPNDETWTFDSTTGLWLYYPPPPPLLLPLDGARMADMTGVGLIMTGGADGTSFHAETWIRKPCTNPPMLSSVGYNGFYFFWVGKFVSLDYTVTGGTPPYTFAGDFLPPGLSVDPMTGVLSGTPTQTSNHEIIISVTDAMGCKDVIHDNAQIRQEPDPVVAEGAGPANPNIVKVYDETGAQRVQFTAYGAGSWGTNLAATALDDRYFTFDARDELVTGPGPGAVFGPQVRAFAYTGNAIAKVNYFAYGTLKYGVNVGSGDVEHDGFDEILTGPGPGAVFGPQVRGFNFDATAITTIAKINYFAYGTLKYGVRVASGEVDVDDYDEMLTGPGPGVIFGPQVRGFNFDNSVVAAIAKINFNAFTTPQFGVNVGADDYDFDGFAEMACAPGPGSTSSFPAQFKGFNYDGASIAAMNGFLVTAFSTYYGGKPGAGALSNDSRVDLLAAAGPDPSADSTIKPYDYTGAALVPFNSFTPFGAAMYGANVVGAALGY